VVCFPLAAPDNQPHGVILLMEEGG